VRVLTKVQGNFSGGGEKISLSEGGRWLLRGWSRQSGVAGETYCFPKSSFQVRPGGQVWHSPQFYAWAHYKQEGPDWPFPQLCADRDQDGWLGDAATMLSGVAGDLSGGGEWVHAIQAPKPNEYSSVRAHSCRGYIEARGHSFFAGVPHSSHRPNVYKGELTVSTTGGRKSITLAAWSVSMCYLTLIRGDFDGGGESIRIYKDATFWHLEVKAGTDRFIEGGARCFLKDQR
jgi:hypothetical protein